MNDNAKTLALNTILLCQILGSEFKSNWNIITLSDGL